MTQIRDKATNATQEQNLKDVSKTNRRIKIKIEREQQQQKKQQKKTILNKQS